MYIAALVLEAILWISSGLSTSDHENEAQDVAQNLMKGNRNPMEITLSSKIASCPQQKN